MSNAKYLRKDDFRINGLEVTILETYRHDPEFLAAQIAGVDIKPGYELGIFEGGGKRDAGLEILKSLTSKVADPFINPISPRSFEIFRELAQDHNNSIEDALRLYACLWFSVYDETKHSSIVHALRPIFSEYGVHMNLENLNQVSPRPDDMKLYLGVLMAGIQEVVAREIAYLMGTNKKVLIYCSKPLKPTVQEAISLIRPKP